MKPWDLLNPQNQRKLLQAGSPPHTRPLWTHFQMLVNHDVMWHVGFGGTPFVLVPLFQGLRGSYLLPNSSNYIICNEGATWASWGLEICLHACKCVKQAREA